MNRNSTSRLNWILLTSLVVAATLGLSWLAWFQYPVDLREAWSIESQWRKIGKDADDLARESVAKRSLDLGRRYPRTTGGLIALELAASRAPNTASGREALQEFVKQIETADVEPVARALVSFGGQWKSLAGAAPALLALARKSADHPRAGQVLADVCLASAPNDDEEPSDVFNEAADLIVEKFASRNDVNHFCETLFEPGAGNAKPWAFRYERHLRSILEKNNDRGMRCFALFALASIVQGQDDRQDEAKDLYTQFCATFDGKQDYLFQTIEQNYFSVAKRQLDELMNRGTNSVVQELVGVDLEGRPLTLAEYRGKVVLMNFWATWCGPCMKLVPDERDLVKLFKDQPFSIVGVNSDDDLDAARKAVAKNDMSWRSFRNRRDNQPPISKDWNIIGYPTLYLIDHHGIVRKRWIGAPSQEELIHAAKVLVDAAKNNLSRDAMKPVIEALKARTPSESKGQSAEIVLAAGHGFLDKTLRDLHGVESKYVVFIPKNYDPAKAWPVVMFLHGAGSRGDDGKLPARRDYALAKAISEKRDKFPMIAVFPQARESEDWTAESAGSQRALAILSHVEREYHIDPDRVTLTGMSMGGEGTWSLAASHPNRWCAIVPICHGWKPEAAAKLKDTPCWCFHGDADDVVPVGQSRAMIKAITEAGGKPLYNELSGVGHNECAYLAYSKAELWDWVLQQKLSR